MQINYLRSSTCYWVKMWANVKQSSVSVPTAEYHIIKCYCTKEILGVKVISIELNKPVFYFSGAGDSYLIKYNQI